MKLNVFTPIKNLKIKYYSNDTVFKPTRTSVLIIKGIEKNKKIFTKYKTLIDLGCGTGILGISLKNIFKKIDVTFADQSSKAVNLTKKNLIHSASHITGGGLVDNLNRSIPEHLSLNLDLSKVKIKNIFTLKGNNLPLHPENE